MVDCAYVKKNVFYKSGLTGGKSMEHHDINLNIHYTMSDDLWKKLSEVYASMPYWAEEEKVHVGEPKILIWWLLLSRVEYKSSEKCQRKYGKSGILN